MKFALAALAALLPTAALASDLPSRKAPPAFVAPVAADTTGWYGALDAGALYSVNTEKFRGSVGARGGYDFGPVRVEGTYDHFGFARRTGVEAFQGNVILQRRLGDFTPYVLAGGGLALNDSDFHFRDSTAIYNVGGGVRYDLGRFGLPRAELDVRYRHVGAAQFAHENKDVVTVGAGYRF
jgi:opacity protein-like surface antigen